MPHSKTVSNWDALPVALDVETVALIFDVTTVTVKHWAYAGKIKGVQTGRKWMFDKDNVRKYLNAGSCSER